MAESMEIQDAPRERSKVQVTAIMIALSLSMFIAALDQTIMATAIPTIAAYFHSSAGYTWIGGAYLLSSAASACIWAKLSDIWGRKPILLLAVGWFFLSSILCAASTSMEMLIAGRALQGVAGGGLLQLVTIIISDLFSVRHRSLYLGLMEVMWAFAGGVGPLLGGAFSQYVTWRWTYWINLPISGVTFVLLFFFLDVHNPQTKIMDGVRAIDWFGSLSVLGLTLMLLLGLDFGGETFAWKSPQVICLIVFGSLCSLLFVYSEKKLAKYPLMPMDIFTRFSNIATLLVAFAHGFVFIAGEYYIPLYLQSVHGSSPMGSGVLILPLVVMEAFSGMFTGAIIHRTGRYLELIWIGLVLMTIGNGLYINLGVGSSVGKIVGYQILSGLGAGFLFQTPIIAIQAMVSQEDTATATATIGFIRNMATAASIVIGGVVFQNSMGQKQSSLLASGMSPSMAAQMSGDSAAASIESIKFITDPEQLLAVREAFAWSLRNMWILYTCMSAVGVFFSAFILKAKLTKEHVETKTGLNVEKTPVVEENHRCLHDPPPPPPPPPFQKLSPKEQQQLDAFRTQGQLTFSEDAQKSYIKDLIDITIGKQKEWEDRRWVLKFDGHTIVPREYMEDIVNCLTLAGDIGVNFLPQPADVVWPVIKGAMQAPITAEAEIGATLTVTDLLVRYISCGNAYEKNYLPKATDQLKERLKSALEDMYVACLKLICVTLKQLQRHTASRLARAFWNPQEVQSQVSELEQFYSTLLGVTQNCQSEIVDQIDDRILDFVKNFNNFESFVANNFHMILERLDEQRITEMLDWISPTKERDRHDPTNTDRLLDTCEWLLQNSTFKEWDMSEEKATLWLQGSLGTGKTYLTSKIIDHLLKTTLPWEGLAYYYCKRTEGHRDEKPDDVIRSLFRQLAAPDQNSKISKDVQSLFLQMKNKTSSPDINICKEQLVKLVNEYSRTTIVLDALDECDKRTRKVLFDFIDRLQSCSEKPIRVFFSARPDPDIKKPFGDHSTIQTRTTDVNGDIRLLIEEKVKDIQCWNDMSEENQMETVDKLLEKGAGMFQLVNLQIPYLIDCGLKQDVFAQLEKIPEDLTKAYEEIYDRLSQKRFQKRLVDRAFMWAMCSYEPLTTDLILAAIRFDGGEEEPQERITKDTLLGLCSNLLVCDTHQDSDSWGFPHASVIDFIEEKLWDVHTAHCYAAKVCLRFLMRVYGKSMSDIPTTHNNANEIVSTRSQDQDILQKNHPFHRYCRHHWVRHVQYQEFNLPNEEGEFDMELRSLLHRFLGSPTQGGPAYQEWYQDIVNDDREFCPLNSIFRFEIQHQDLSPPILPVLAMSRLSFDGILSDWWDSYEISSSHINDRNEAPLILAAKAGCFSICERLIRKGASVNQCANGFSALSAAAQGGNINTAKLLIEHGASVDLLIQGYLGSALAAAACDGNIKMAKLLIEHGASVDLLLQGYFESALAAAVWYGGNIIAQLLLDHGASVDLLLQGNYGSALTAATRGGKDKIVQLLLDHGASVDLLLQGSYGSALAAAAYGGEDKIVQLLLDHGASIDLPVQSGFYGSSLAAAAAKGNALVVKYFISQCNANVNLTLTTGRYGTALNAASYWGQIDCVKILLQAGAIVDRSLTPQGFSDAFLASEAVVVTNDSYRFPESRCWGDRTEREMADDKQEVTRILKESVSSKAISE
ncbi:Major facilitator superfamily domain, general substrate transporter [Penicillium expansum]|nr:Major facilitator superfamily domain, general substrate transporter [Penicillium expansum]